MSKEKKLVNGAELAREFNVTKQSIYKAEKTGRLRVAAMDSKGRSLFDLAEARRTLIIDKPNGFSIGKGNEEKAAAEHYAKARAEHEQIKAEQRALELKIRQEELIDRATVRAQGAELGAIMKGFLDAFPGRHAAIIAAMNDQHDVYLYLQKEINQMKIDMRARCGC